MTVGTIRRVIVPMCPPEELNPNSRVHWRPYRRASGALRTAAKYAALEHGGTDPIVGRVDVSIRVCWPKRRRVLDADNALASCKAALDGLTDAGVWQDDRQMRRVSVEQEKLDKAGNAMYPGGAIVVDIEEVSR